MDDLENALKRAKMYACQKLSRQALSTHQLRRKLSDKGIDEGIIESVIEEFKSLGYLDDEAFGASLVQGQVRRHKSSYQITSKLVQKGISYDEAKRFISENSSPEAEKAALQVLVEKAKRLNRPEEKIIASLMRKGFSYEEIVACLT